MRQCMIYQVTWNTRGKGSYLFLTVILIRISFKKTSFRDFGDCSTRSGRQLTSTGSWWFLKTLIRSNFLAPFPGLRRLQSSNSSSTLGTPNAKIPPGIFDCSSLKTVTTSSQHGDNKKYRRNPKKRPLIQPSSRSSMASVISSHSNSPRWFSRRFRITCWTIFVLFYLVLWPLPSNKKKRQHKNSSCPVISFGIKQTGKKEQSGKPSTYQNRICIVTQPNKRRNKSTRMTRTSITLFSPEVSGFS